MQYSLAPLQGITDYVFRRLICKHFHGIDKVFSPFLRLQNDKSIKKSHLIDILPENNVNQNLVPQILCNNSNDFLYLSKLVTDFGYKELNWNLGCPFPMVTKRRLGSGLLPFPDLIDKILEECLPKLNCHISIKLRIGYESNNEIIKLLPIFAKYPLKELIIHPRIGTQGYKGSVDIDIFRSCIKNAKTTLAYNGDIVNLESYSPLPDRFPSVTHWMIGRGLLANPFLIEEIISNRKTDLIVRKERFFKFHDELFENCKERLNGAGHILIKMLQYWEYFSQSVNQGHKAFKLLKKAKSIEKFEYALCQVKDLY